MEKPLILLGSVEDVSEEMLSMMPLLRREHILRLKHELDRKRSLSAGFLLLRGLTEWGILTSPEQGAELKMALTEKGKPFLPDYPGLHFSLSHAGTRTMCVLADRPVGCDIEEINRGDLKIARRFFAPRELEQMIARPDRQQETFCRIWTLKESLLKALGTGLLTPMNAYTVLLGEEQTVIDGHPEWVTGESVPGEGYRAAWVMQTTPESADIR